MDVRVTRANLAVQDFESAQDFALLFDTVVKEIEDEDLTTTEKEEVKDNYRKEMLENIRNFYGQVLSSVMERDGLIIDPTTDRGLLKEGTACLANLMQLMFSQCARRLSAEQMAEWTRILNQVDMLHKEPKAMVFWNQHDFAKLLWKSVPICNRLLDTELPVDEELERL